MTAKTEILIGNQRRDFAIIRVGNFGIEGWANAEMEVQCDGWKGSFSGYLMKGELGRLAKELKRLGGDLHGAAELRPLEPNLILNFKGDGRGHFKVTGKARNHFDSMTELRFAFDIDQTYLQGIIGRIEAADPEGEA